MTAARIAVEAIVFWMAALGVAVCVWVSAIDHRLRQSERPELPQDHVIRLTSAQSDRRPYDWADPELDAQ